MTLFDLGYNRLEGWLPAFLNRTSMPEGMRRIFLKVCFFSCGLLLLACPGLCPAPNLVGSKRLCMLLLQGNNLKINCSDENFGYIVSLCPPPQQRPKQHRRPAQEAQPK